MRLRECGQPARHQRLGQQRRGAHAQHARRFAARGTGQRLDGGGCIGPLARMPVHGLAHRRDRHAVAGALQQARTELRLQLRDATAQARFRNAGGAFGGGEAAGLHHTRKEVEIVEAFHAEGRQAETATD
ncbi:hypothetical protein LBM2029_17580 (plasmid) [Ralstonia solanacearum]|nr:hypothetical protein LBM2029_17580 [Ralstonia solanacearum]